jgi:hypothetical protein
VSAESATIGKHPPHRTMWDMHHDLLIALKALADPNRLRVAAACAGEPRTLPQIAAELGMAEPAVRRHLDRLLGAGLVAFRPSVGYSLQVSAIHAVGRRLGAIQADDAPVSGVIGADGAPLSPDEAKVIRAFVRDDRLIDIPSQEKKRLIVCRYLRDRCFTEDRPYPEKEVNQRLALFHPDVATLRRAMVDDGLMVRANGIYRRPT